MMKKLKIGLALFLCGVAHAQVYNQFSPGGALTGTWNSQNVNVGAGSPFIIGVLPQGNGGTGQVTPFTGIVYSTAGVYQAAVAGNFPTLNQNTTGTAVNLSGTPALPNGTTATTQSAGDTTTKLATDGFVSTIFAAPPAIGNTTPGAGAFTTLSASSTVSGTGFSSYLASPPAIGGTAPSAGTFTALTSNGAANINASNNAATNIGTGTTTSAVNIGGGSDAVVIVGNGGATSTINNVRIGGTTAAVGAFTTLTSTGLFSPQLGITATGGIVSLNASNNFVTNIGTGTTTSAVNIGGGSNAVVINSTASGTMNGVVIGGTLIENGSFLGLTSQGTTGFNTTGTAATQIGTGSSTTGVTIGNSSNGLTVNATAIFNNHSYYTGTAPTVSACGTSSIDAHATDTSGTVTPGTAASCTITFATAYVVHDHCVVTSETTLAAFAYSYTLSAITVTATALAGGKIDYHCDGH